MQRITLAAYTPPGTQPAYFNATLVDGMVEVTVRGPLKADGNFGDTAMIRLDRSVFDAIMTQAGAALALAGRVVLTG